MNPFLNIFRKTNTKIKNKTENKVKKTKIKGKNKIQKKIPKKVTFGISIQQTGSFSNEQDCLQELKKNENKGGKCILLGVGSYTIEKEI